ncbi:MAG TPA: cupin domain-containing protein [Thermoanaerobaculia bacterium]|nr:cupin domain-containing protein [Thermoanaerobaculia bacterium]
MLSAWLSGMSVDDFMRQHYQRAPLALPTTARDAVPLLDWNTMQRLIESHADMLLVRNSKLRREREPETFAEVRALYDEGFSIVLRGCERYDEGLRALAERFDAEVPGDPSVQIYATPKKHHSFSWHYDCEDVFIAQTAGTKEYFMRRNTVNPEPMLDAMPRDMHYERETSPMIATTLVAGDWLYIPRGWWHVARALDDSLSISIGVLSPAAAGKR